MATPYEIGTWIDALGRRLSEIGKEIEEIKLEIGDNGLTEPEQKGLTIRLGKIKRLAAAIGKS